MSLSRKIAAALDENTKVHAPPCAGTPFADRGCVRIVVETDRAAETVCHVVTKREIAQRQIHALDDDARDLVDRRRRPEAEGSDVVVEQHRDGRLELADHRFLRIVRRDAFVAPDDRAVPSDHPGEDLRPAEVHPDRMTAVHPQWVP